jgi:hypothetical protein
MAPLDTAAPSVLTARPIQAAATIGSSDSHWRAARGSAISSTTEKTTTRDETMTGTTGRARMAAPVVMAADTPQMEMPEASGAAHSRLKPKKRRATK